MRYLVLALMYVIGFFIGYMAHSPQTGFILGLIPVSAILYVYGKQMESADRFLKDAQERLSRQTLNTILDRYMVVEYNGSTTVREVVRMATGQLFIIRDGKHETITPLQFETFSKNYIKEFIST